LHWWKTKMGELAGKVALVTGAGRGIGKVIAETLAAASARVVLVSRTPAELTAVREAIEHSGGKAWSMAADVSDEGAVKSLLAEVAEICGRLDILVNNAGVATRGSIAETTVADWDQAMAVNARGPFLVCREAAPLMARSGGGHIINMASVVGVKGYVNQGAYTASKHALMGFTKVLAQELKPLNIRVHAICPGGVDSDMVRKTRPDLDPGQLIRPEEIARIVLFLTGQTGKSVVDEIHVRREANDPWFSE
jgi:3-oxoacyl-[acyl-carrier protein] reductase